MTSHSLRRDCTGEQWRWRDVESVWYFTLECQVYNIAPASFRLHCIDHYESKDKCGHCKCPCLPNMSQKNVVCCFPGPDPSCVGSSFAFHSPLSICFDAPAQLKTPKMCVNASQLHNHVVNAASTCVTEVDRLSYEHITSAVHEAHCEPTQAHMRSFSSIIAQEEIWVKSKAG